MQLLAPPRHPRARPQRIRPNAALLTAMHAGRDQPVHPEADQGGQARREQAAQRDRTGIGEKNPPPEAAAVPAAEERVQRPLRQLPRYRPPRFLPDPARSAPACRNG